MLCAAGHELGAAALGVVLAGAALAATACGGSTAAQADAAAQTDAASSEFSNGDAAAVSSYDASGTGTRCLAGDAGVVHRQQATTCAATPNPFLVSDAGPPACTTVADCPMGSRWAACIQGQCHFDACLADSDCPADTLCACLAGYGSAFVQANACLSSNCRTDGDCGPGAPCSPSFGSCRRISGYYSHTSSDAGMTDADCCGDPSTPYCTYEPTIGHWTCAAASVCAG